MNYVQFQHKIYENSFSKTNDLEEKDVNTSVIVVLPAEPL